MWLVWVEMLRVLVVVGVEVRYSEMGVLIGSHLIGQRVHDDRVGHQAQRVDLSHQHVGRDLVELDVLQEVPEDLLQRQVLRIKVDLEDKG